MKSVMLQRLGFFAGLIVAYLIFIGGYIDNLGQVSIFWFFRTPPGQITFVMAKWLGLTAMFVLLLHMMLGIMVRIRQTKGLAVADWRNTHEMLAHLLFNLVLSHVVLFVTAVSLRTGKVSFDPLLLNVGDFYHQMLTVGVVAGALLLVTSLLVFFRKTSLVRSMHKYFGSLVAALALWHALAIGSELTWQLVCAVAVMLGAILAAFWKSENLVYCNRASIES